jgi:hypothetical protein
MNVRTRKHTIIAYWRLVTKKSHQLFSIFCNTRRPHGHKERIMRAIKTCLAILAMVFFITACGGGGGSSDPTPPAGSASNPASATLVTTGRSICVIPAGADRCSVGVQVTWANASSVSIKDGAGVSVAVLGTSPATTSVDVTLAGRSITPYNGTTAIGASLALTAGCSPGQNLIEDQNGFCNAAPVVIVWPAPKEYVVGNVIDLIPPGKPGANQLPVVCTGSSVLQDCYQQSIADGTAKVAVNHLVDPRDGKLMSVVLFYNRNPVLKTSGTMTFLLVHETDGSLVAGQNVQGGVGDLVTKALVTADGILYRNDTTNRCGTYSLAVGWTVVPTTCPPELLPVTN